MPTGQTDNTVVIISVLTSGVLTPSVVAAYALHARRRDERHNEREHELTLCESALNSISRERRLLHVGFSMWRHGAPPMDPAVLANDKAVAETIEAVWTSENELRIRFGDGAPVVSAHSDLVAALDRLKDVYDRHGDGRAPTRVDSADWIDAANTVVRQQKAFVRTIRQQTRLDRDQGEIRPRQRRGGRSRSQPTATGSADDHRT
jgi:hypothetical protein